MGEGASCCGAWTRIVAKAIATAPSVSIRKPWLPVVILQVSGRWWVVGGGLLGGGGGWWFVVVTFVNNYLFVLATTFVLVLLVLVLLVLLLVLLVFLLLVLLVLLVLLLLLQPRRHNIVNIQRHFVVRKPRWNDSVVVSLPNTPVQKTCCLVSPLPHFKRYVAVAVVAVVAVVVAAVVAVVVAVESKP